jgi:hypothetical protein
MSRVSAALALCAFGLVLGGGQHAAAGPVSDPDFDGDFLSDAQEWVLGTNPLAGDSDGDGFGDLEELARGSSPVLASQLPTNAVPVHIGMTAHAGSDGRIHVLVAMHSTVQNARSIQLAFGAQIDQRVFVMTSTWLATHSTMQVTTGAGGQSLLTLMDIPFSSSAILAAGHLTFFATVSIPGSGVLSADAVSLVNVDGVVALLGPPPPQNGHTEILPGSIYIPLPSGGPGSVPSSWSEGSVCYQRAAPVAVNGAVVTQEVISAGCVEGFEGYCPPSCAASVGSTYSTIDPIGLIGG